MDLQNLPEPATRHQNQSPASVRTEAGEPLAMFTLQEIDSVPAEPIRRQNPDLSEPNLCTLTGFGELIQLILDKPGSVE